MTVRLGPDAPHALHIIALDALPRPTAGTYRPGIAAVVGLLLVALIIVLGHANNCDAVIVDSYAHALDLAADGYVAASGETMVPGRCA